MGAAAATTGAAGVAAAVVVVDILRWWRGGGEVKCWGSAALELSARNFQLQGSRLGGTCRRVRFHDDISETVNRNNFPFCVLLSWST